MVAVAYVRTVKTASGVTAVQIVYSKRRGARRMEHVGSAHDEQELEALKAAARQRLAGGQQELGLGLDAVDGAVVRAAPAPRRAPAHGRPWRRPVRCRPPPRWSSASSPSATRTCWPARWWNA